MEHSAGYFVSYLRLRYEISRSDHKKCSESKTLRSAGHVSDSQEKDIKVYSVTAMSAFITFIRAYESDQNSKMSGIKSEIEEITDI